MKGLQDWERIILRKIANAKPFDGKDQEEFLLMQASYLMKEDSPKWASEHYSCSTQLIRLIVPCPDFDTVATIVTAGVMLHPATSVQWMRTIEPLLTTGPDGEDWKASYGKPTGEFILGTILGIYEGASWLGEHRLGTNSPYLKHLSQFTADLFTWRYPEREFWAAKLTDPILPDPKWENRLGQAIKAWGRGDSLGLDKSIRLGEFMAMFRTIVNKRNANQINDEYPKILLTLLDQISYTILGRLSPGGRAYLLDLGLADIFQPFDELFEKNKAESPS